jgi:hypothetical protein
VAVVNAIRRAISYFLGTYCKSHRIWYRSDFCPHHNKAMFVRFETRDVR